jgi:hypothetical protein
MTVSFQVGDLVVTSGNPHGASIDVDVIKDHTGSSGVDGQVLGRDLTGLLWANFPQASLSGAGLVQLSDSTGSSSTTLAATANAVKTSYDLAAAAIPSSSFTVKGDILAATGAGTYSGLTLGSNGQVLTVDTTTATGVKWAASGGGGGTNPFASSNALFVNPTIGNNSTAARGTSNPYLTLTAALAAALEGDFIYMAPGTYTENPVITKGVTILGTYQDQGTWQGTKILGNTQLNLSASVTRNCAIYNVYFISANSTPAFDVIAHATSAGNTIISNCMFTQQTATDVNQFGFRTAATNWVRAIYTRNCAFDGNVKHNAGTAAGASGYLVMDNTIGTGSSSYYYHVLTGTVEFRNPSQALSPIYQTGGVVSTSNVLGFTNNSATTTTIFGGTGFNYKGSAASVGTGVISFSGGSNVAGGKVDVGANLIYRWGNLNVTPANLTIAASAVAYTTSVPASASIVVAQQTRPQFDLLKATSVVTTANQLSTVIDSTTGILYSVDRITLPLTTLTTTSTASTTLLSVSATAFRGGIINLCVSDATSGKFWTDTLQFVNDSGFTNLQVIAGARVAGSPYTASVAQVGANLVVSVISASANSTKYVGNYMTFAI